MESIIPVNENLFWVGSNDRTSSLFESLWPLPRGISYNSYLFVDEKITLLDTVKDNSIVQFIEKIKYLTQKYGQLDYLIINHIEPDHSGAVSVLRTIWPDVRIIGNNKTAHFLKELYGIRENIQTIHDGEEISLGKHHLKFLLTPMVHWPETMMTYEMTRHILFSGDAFGGFGTLDGAFFDDEVDLEYYEDEILRYFSNIIGKYSLTVQKAIGKLRGLDIKMVASTHGPIWRSNPQEIINKYDRWSQQKAEKGAVAVYASMYGNTTKMMESAARGFCRENNEDIRIHDVSRVHLSYLIRDIWKYKAIIFASPTYDAHLFPPMAFLLHLLDRKGVKNKVAGIIGTYGWSGGGLKNIREFVEKNGWELLEPVVETHFAPTEEDLQRCYELGQNCRKKL